MGARKAKNATFALDGSAGGSVMGYRMVSRKRLLACAVGGVIGGVGFFAMYYFGTYSAFGGDAFRSLLLPSVVGVVMGAMLGWAIGARWVRREKVAGGGDATGEGVDV